jgi:hypothetical protein
MEAIPKIIIANDADELLEKMLKQVNEGFPSGRVKKAQLATWIIKDFHERTFLKVIDKIRDDHFDEITHLKSVLKQMEEARKNNGEVKLTELLMPMIPRQKANASRESKATEENRPKS